MKNLWNVMKQKVDGASSSMQDGDWNAMESMLNDHPQFKPTRFSRKKLGLLLLFTTAFVGTSAYLVYSNLKEDTGIRNTDQIQEVISVETPAESELVHEPTPATSGEHLLEPATAVRSDEVLTDGSQNLEIEAQPHNNEPTVANLLSSPVEEESVTNGMANTEERAAIDELVQDARMEVVDSDELPVDHSESLADDRSMVSEDALETTGDEFGEYELTEDPILSSDKMDSTNTSIADDIAVLEDQVQEVDSASHDDIPVITESDETPDVPLVIENKYNRDYQWMLDGAYGASPSVNTALITQEVGLELAYEYRGWTAQAGIQWAQTQGRIFSPFTELVRRSDTSFNTVVQSRIEDRVIRTWVVTGYYTGEYVYDTTQVTVYDTVQVAVIDTSSSNVTRFKSETIRTSYLQIPLAVGYQWAYDKWSFGVQAGVNMRRVSYISDEFEAASAYGFDALLRPSVTYRIAERWHILSRVSLNIPVSNDPLLNANNFTRVGASVGVRYVW